MEEKASDELLDLREWIPGFCIDDACRTALCFRETLIIGVKNGSGTNGTKQVGGYCIQVESVGPEGREFLVHVHSSMTVDGYFSGTKLISSMTEKLQCLEEKHTEYGSRTIREFHSDENGLHEKSLIVGLQENAYHVEITRTCPFDVSPLTESKDLKLCQYKSLISEGVGVLLMRYLAITNFDGTLRFQNIAIDGEIIVSDYICTALRDIELRGHHQKVYTVERKIYKDDSLTQQVKIYLTPEGRILIHDWLDVPYVVQNNPLLQNLADAGTNGQVPMREQWMQDIQMVSKYLDAKSCNTAHYTDYLVDHPEIKQLITDYVQSLLVVKPVDVIGFTIQYFKAFTREPKVWIDDSFTRRSNIDINPQLSRDESDITCGLCGVCIKCKIVSQFDKTLSD
ncbi:hypothetical protein DMN91_003875 [Ooceraea biroi]|uniref:Ciliogenesis-associated TTC17-interacting protein N-terminal domain-containing protein n=1 Tax=Ooceraea biroi TaxID=2015173 RepID=A0A3L8DUT2_OOCBI|nr:hypothetical protein DMN91_003875 [Ooceraea biroi]